MNLAHQIKKARIARGISQNALARLADISLLSLQKLENGRSNPTWQTVISVTSVLRLDFSLSAKPADWESFSAIGLPLTGLRNKKVSGNEKKLIEHCLTAANELAEADSSEERKQESLTAVLLALQHHYPPVYKKISKNGNVSKLVKTKLTGRLIKLRRLALARISKYL